MGRAVAAFTRCASLNQVALTSRSPMSGTSAKLAPRPAINQTTKHQVIAYQRGGIGARIIHRRASNRNTLCAVTTTHCI
jgi:hypothetical protein